MVAFPIAKLGAIIIKQVSKPLANLAKAKAKQSPFFRNYVCMPPAQFYHWCEVKLKMWSMNLGKPVNIPKLNEASAIDLGAELVGEAVIFSIATEILIFEYSRQVRKENAKEAERIAELEQIQEDLKNLYTQKAQQENQIRELIRILHEKLPGSHFCPAPFDESCIPEHHRISDDKVEAAGAFNTMKSWVFNAIDFVLPSPDNTTQPENQSKIVVIQKKPEPSSSGDTNNNSSSSSSRSSELYDSSSNKVPDNNANSKR